MNPPVPRSHTLSAVEREALVTIRVLRDAAHRPQNSSASLELTVVIHNLIVTYHGHVELRLHVLARELGTTMRVIERKFEARYGMTMHELLDTLSYYDNSEPHWDEKTYFSITEMHRGKTGTHIDSSAFRWTFELPDATESTDCFPGVHARCIGEGRATGKADRTSRSPTDSSGHAA
ncbi:hypothetical protein HDF11_005414 [Tunturiibacter psychrotolerans]